MLGEISAAISGVKGAYDIAQGLKGIHDAVKRDEAISTLVGTLIMAQGEQLAAQQRISNLLKIKDQLEAEIATLRAWGAEKETYELKAISAGAFAYMKKPAARGDETPHWLCQTCFEDGKKSAFQYQGQPAKNVAYIYKCPRCNGGFQVTYGTTPVWLEPDH